jgi:hypothetical protein
VSLLLCAALSQADIRIQVVEGDDLTQSPGSTSYRGLSVRVLSESGRPVPDALITFQLPETEPSGIFPNGTKTERLVADINGLASVWGIKWGATPGWCTVAIMAKAGPATAGTVAHVRISSAPAATIASFEVTVSSPRPSPDPSPPPAAASTETVAVAPLPVRRPGVVLTQTTERLDKLPNPWVKRVLILLGIAGGTGGFVAYRLMQPAAVAPPVMGVVPTPLTLSSPNITIGKP